MQFIGPYIINIIIIIIFLTSVNIIPRDDKN